MHAHTYVHTHQYSKVSKVMYNVGKMIVCACDCISLVEVVPSTYPPMHARTRSLTHYSPTHPLTHSTVGHTITKDRHFDLP